MSDRELLAAAAREISLLGAKILEWSAVMARTAEQDRSTDAGVTIVLGAQKGILASLADTCEVLGIDTNGSYRPEILFEIHARLKS